MNWAKVYRDRADQQATLARRLVDRGGCDTALRTESRRQAKLEQFARTAARWTVTDMTPLDQRPGGFPGDIFNDKPRVDPAPIIAVRNKV